MEQHRQYQLVYKVIKEAYGPPVIYPDIYSKLWYPMNRMLHAIFGHFEE